MSKYTISDLCLSYLSEIINIVFEYPITVISLITLILICYAIRRFCLKGRPIKEVLSYLFGSRETKEKIYGSSDETFGTGISITNQLLFGKTTNEKTIEL